MCIQCVTYTILYLLLALTYCTYKFISILSSPGCRHTVHCAYLRYALVGSMH